MTTNELCMELPITLCWVIRNCSVVCRVIGNSMHSSFVIIWNSADSSVLCWVIRNCSIRNYPANYRTIPNYLAKYRTIDIIPNYPADYRIIGRIPNYHKRTMHRITNIRNCSVVCRVIANSMHSSFVVIWNSADSSVLCWVIRNCSVVCRVIGNSMHSSFVVIWNSADNYHKRTMNRITNTLQTTELLAEFQITTNELCMELPITQHTTEEFLITLQSTALSAEFQITTNELCIELPITVVCLVIGNSMHSSFVVIWNSAINSVVCRVIRNYIDSSVLC
jgi:hypothetical protein